MAAVIFDLDGTLIDSLADIGNSLNVVLGEHGLPVHPLQAYKTLVGDGASELVWRALPEAQREPFHKKILDAYRARYRSHLVVDSRPYEGIEPLLDLLEARGVPKSVVTNKPHGAAVTIMERLFPKYRWISILGQQEGTPHKPDPAMAWQAARSMSKEPRQCFFVGDTHTDMNTAKNASMVAVGCLWGFRDRTELEASGAQFVISHPRELVPILDQFAH